MNAMLASDLPLPRIGRGKVRDIYAVGDDRVLLLTTDRISAFDVVMAGLVPAIHVYLPSALSLRRGCPAQGQGRA